MKTVQLPSITTWVRPEIQQLSPYHVPDPGHAIKLDAMENPYQWNTELTEQWLRTLQNAAINRYPDPSARELKNHLRSAMQLPEDMEIILGNGSDELIQMLLLTFSGVERTVIAPEPSFAMYKLTAQVVGMPYIGVELQAEDFSLDTFAMLEAIDMYQPALIFLAYPNNPTGNAFEIADIEAILETAPGIVVLDEAYAPFADDSFISRLGDYPNLLVMRTLSKLGLAGLRLGFLVGRRDWLEQIEKTRLPYNINILTQMSVTFALRHYSVFQAQTEQIKQDRTLLLQYLQKLPNVQVWNSQANFILMRVENATEVFNGLRERKILIKNWHGAHPLLNNCLRVTVGTPLENELFLKALTELI